MKARLSTTSVTNDLTLTNHDRNWADTPQASFYEGEWQGRALRKLSGQEVTVPRRRRKAVEAPTRALGGETSSRQEAALGPYQTL